jgi:hypothetical protein
MIGAHATQLTFLNALAIGRKRISFNTNLNLNIASHHLQNSDEFRILVTFLSLFHYHSRRCAQCNLRLRHDVVIEV